MSMHVKNKLAQLCRILILIFYIFLCVHIYIYALSHNLKYALCGIIAAVFFAFIGVVFAKNIHFETTKSALFLMIVLCSFVKIYTICFYQPTPVADYNTYYEFAQQLANGYVLSYNPLYISIFPHVFGYAEFLSIFYLVFGASIYIPIIINVILSIISLILIFSIADIIKGQQFAICCSCLWIIFPSQSLWNGFILSEPLYVTELLLFWYLALHLQKNKEPSRKSYILALLSGIVLILFNMSRPVGIIVLFALFIWFILMDINNVNKHRICLLLLIAAVYFVGCFLANKHIESRIGYKTGGFSWYNVSVGLNESSNGTWNQEDWDLLLTKVNEYAQSGSANPAYDVQMLSKKRALTKLKSIHHPLILVHNKLDILFGDDSAVIEHMKASNVPFDEAAYNHLYLLVNSFYYLLIVFSFYGGYIILIKEKSSGLTFIILYSIGLTLGHVLVEVQGRYHYSILLGFIFVAGYGMSSLVSKFCANISFKTSY